MSLYHKCELNLKYFNSRNRRFCLDIFDINIYDSNIEWNNIIKETQSYSNELEKKYYENFNIDPINNNYEISGYWQNENYFLKYEKNIRNIFNIEPIKLDKNTLVIQIRRRDFVNNPRFAYCTKSWYDKAISEFQIKNDIIILSDDPEWCKTNFKIYNPNIIIGNELTHLKYMAGADNIIISNSTFGWWGAWLSDSENVVCPAVWLPCVPEQDTARKKWKKLI
jgi:hypothetical protein